MKIQAPVAFLLVKFQGSTDEPITTAAAATMFTATGRGTLNVVDWFDDNTHGNVDMTGNAVFGWLELNETLNGYSSKRADGTYGRGKIIDLGRAAASAAGIDLSGFAVVVVVTNLGLDLFGGTGFVCCTAAAGRFFWENQAAPSVLCQEMIHGLGVYEHTRRSGSDIDYEDTYDVMSMFHAYPGHHPNNANIPIGPGLNAAFMERCGWLDTTRVAPDGQVMLRPLHRRDLPGPLYAKVSDYYIEYRPSRRWDTGFSSIVLVHYIRNNTSYLAAELQASSEFTWGDPLSLFGEHGSIKVDSIDDAAETATITAFYRDRSASDLITEWRSVSPRGFRDGGLLLIGGRIVKIPPRSPELRLVETAAALVSLNEIRVTPSVQTAARADLYAQAVDELKEAHAHITEPSSPHDHINAEEAERFHRRKVAKERISPNPTESVRSHLEMKNDDCGCD